MNTGIDEVSGIYFWKEDKKPLEGLPREVVGLSIWHLRCNIA